MVKDDLGYTEHGNKEDHAGNAPGKATAKYDEDGGKGTEADFTTKEIWGDKIIIYSLDQGKANGWEE